MKLLPTPADISHCDEIGLLLEAFWQGRGALSGRLSPAYRAMTGFLLGIRLLERFDSEAIRQSRLCPLDPQAIPYEAKALSGWCLHAQACFGQVGYHAMEALALVFHQLYGQIEADPALRTSGGKVLSSEEWSASAVGLALWIDDVGRFSQLREACLAEARASQDWLTLGLACADVWWPEGTGGEIPPSADVTAALLAAPYGDARGERLQMTRLLTEIKLEGIADGAAQGDLEKAVKIAYRCGHRLVEENRRLYREILVHDADSRDMTVLEDLKELIQLYARYIPTSDPENWESHIGMAALRFSQDHVRIGYLPAIAHTPSVFRAALDFGFWGGLVKRAIAGESP